MRILFQIHKRLRPFHRLGSRRHRESGQSMIELALVVPLLVLVLVAAVELGRMGYAKVACINAARAGVAYGSQNVFTAVDSSGMEAAALSDGADVAAWKSNGFTASATRFCLCSDGNTIVCTNAAIDCVTPNRSSIYVEVDTQANVDTHFNLPGIPHNYTVTGKAVMRVQQ